ncbi:MAG: glycosyltransferase, partial [Fimbriimonadales bacterium]|nr:glycosyltransferase [Fimbriimonadales bacterium]
CSPDNTAQVVEQYLGDPRIKLIRNEQNLGECGSRNRALDVAQGEWIALLDADDWYEPRRLERLLEAAHESNEKVIFDLQAEVINGARLPMRFSDVYDIPTTLRRFDKYEYAHGHIGGQPLVYHAIIQKHRLTYPVGILKGGDFVFQMRVVARAGSMLLIPETHYNYRSHPQSMMANARSSWQRNLELSRVLYKTLLAIPEAAEDPRLKHILHKTAARMMCSEVYYPFVHALRAREWNTALQIFRAMPTVGVRLFTKAVKKALHLAPARASQNVGG